MAETEDKPSYKERLSNAIKWLQEEPTEKATTAGRIFDVKPDSIRATLRRSSFIRRPRGGQNKVLSDAQTEAIKLYWFEQWQVGLGATKQMVFAAITFLKASEEPTLPMFCNLLTLVFFAHGSTTITRQSKSRLVAWTLSIPYLHFSGTCQISGSKL